MTEKPHLFKKGQSGNPKGRTPKIATAQALRDELMPDMPEILKVLKKQAKEGDQGAIKLLLDRCYPALKPQSLPVEITTPAGTSLGQTGESIINTALQGGISPDTAHTLLGALASQIKVVEATDIAERLDRLEKQAGLAK